MKKSESFEEKQPEVHSTLKHPSDLGNDLLSLSFQKLKSGGSNSDFSVLQMGLLPCSFPRCCVHSSAEELCGSSATGSRSLQLVD